MLGGSCSAAETATDGGAENAAESALCTDRFRKRRFVKKLTNAGFDRRKKFFFSWLGVSYYLSGEQIDTMLSSLTALSFDVSALLFDFADENLFSTFPFKIWLFRLIIHLISFLENCIYKY